MNNVILFDGVCNFCNGAVNFVIAHDPTRSFKFASLQSDFGRELLKTHGKNPEILDSIILYQDQRIYEKSDAVLEITKHLKGYTWLYTLRYIPRTLRDAVYQIIAKNRYRIFGRANVCRIPTAEERDLFLG